MVKVEHQQRTAVHSGASADEPSLNQALTPTGPQSANLHHQAILDREAQLDREIPRLDLRHQSGPIPFEDTIWIAQQEVGFADGQTPQRYMGSPYFRNCSMVAAWNPDTKESAVFHVSNKTNVHDVVNHLENLTAEGEWEITMAGGSEFGVHQEIYGGHRYNWLLADELNQLAEGNPEVSFGFQRPTGREPTSTNDRSYLLDRDTGEVFSVENDQVAQVEKETPERLGPNFTERFNDANLFPYLSVAAPPCVVAFRDGEYTGNKPEASPQLVEILDALKEDYQGLRQQSLSDETEIVDLPVNIQLRALQFDFVDLLKEHLPNNAYLIQRCENEAMMRKYMQERLLIHWGEIEEHPIDA